MRISSHRSAASLFEIAMSSRFTLSLLSLVFLRLPRALPLASAAASATTSCSEVTVSASHFQDLNIKAILSDIDGTLITSSHTISDRLKQSITRAMSRGVHFIPATGRSRKSMHDATKDVITSLYGGTIENVPGVYNQGLEVYGMNGKLIFERFLDLDVLQASLQACELFGSNVIAFAGSAIYCQAPSDKVNSILASYAEPPPVVFSDGLDRLHLSTDFRINKLILIDDDDKLLALRPRLEELLKGKASVTKAVLHMLEILPYGASKGDGVRRLLEHYNIPLENSIAFGDGENDIEMLSLVKVGIAVANARPALKAVSSAISFSNDEEGVAHVLDLLFPEI